MKVKHIIYFLVFVTFNFPANSQSLNLNEENKVLGNSISPLDTIKDRIAIEKFALSIDTSLKYFKIPSKVIFIDNEIDSIANKLAIEPITKIDMNNDNLIDLIIIYTDFDIFYLYIDKELNRIRLDHINGVRGNQIIRPIIKHKRLLFEHTSIFYYYEGEEFNGELIVNQVEFINGNFIESSLKSNKYEIEAIEFSTSGCLGECPVFNLNIFNNRNATYNAIKYNDTQGNYDCVIDQKSYLELEQLLNYIDFANLENEYQVGHTDDQTGILKITYDNGKVKNIYDYGMAGTLGLRTLYKMLLKLRGNQTWKKI